jgi:hypothetical protein
MNSGPPPAFDQNIRMHPSRAPALIRGIARQVPPGPACQPLRGRKLLRRQTLETVRQWNQPCFRRPVVD